MSQGESLRERRSREIRTARVNRRPAGLGATLIAFTVVFALAWVFFIRQPPQAPVPSIKAVRGTYEWRPGGRRSVGEDGTFSAVASGNAGGKAHTPKGATVFSYWPPESAYDAARRAETTLGGNGGRFAFASRTVGAWPPVWRVATHSPLDYQGLAAIVRTAVEDRDHSVGIKPLKDGDRDVWRAAMTIDRKTVELVVDQLTGLVLWYTDGNATFSASVAWDSPPPADETYTVNVPAGTSATRTTDRSFTYVTSPDAAGRAAGYDPLVSGLAPDGYALTAVATFQSGFQPMVWLSNGEVLHPPPVGPDDRGIALLYTRGLSAFTVEQLGPKSTGFYQSAASDKLKQLAATALSYEVETLQYGALKGSTAHTWYEESGPSMYLSDGRRSVFVTGALTRQELIDFANGLKPVASGGATAGGSPPASPTPGP